MNNNMNSRIQKKKNHYKNAKEVLTWVKQLCLHLQMKYNIFNILENAENKIEVSKYCVD